MDSEIKPDRELDCRGMKCPMPILRTKKEMETLKVGQILKMTSTDKGSKPDMMAFAERTGHELLRMDENAGLFTYYIRKSERR
jgi:tRNA 2-thiouridine synthesizing protein A